MANPYENTAIRELYVSVMRIYTDSITAIVTNHIGRIEGATGKPIDFYMEAVESVFIGGWDLVETLIVVHQTKRKLVKEAKEAKYRKGPKSREILKKSTRDRGCKNIYLMCFCSAVNNFYAGYLAYDGSELANSDKAHQRQTVFQIIHLALSVFYAYILYRHHRSYKWKNSAKTEFDEYPGSTFGIAGLIRIAVMMTGQMSLNVAYLISGNKPSKEW